MYCGVVKSRVQVPAEHTYPDIMYECLEYTDLRVFKYRNINSELYTELFFKQ